MTYDKLGSVAPNRTKEQEFLYDWNLIGEVESKSPSVVEIDDETLRDGLQGPSVRQPKLDEKIEILHKMETLGIDAADIADDALQDPEILRLSRAMTMMEDDRANAAFPAQRLARVALTLTDGTRLESDWTTPKWDPAEPPTEAELREKFHRLADPVLGPERARAIEDALHGLPDTAITPLYGLLAQPISARTVAARSA